MKTYHMADKINPQGGVSALCFEKPRAIDLTRATWTNRAEAVTCKKCLKILMAKGSNVKVRGCGDETEK